MVNTRLNINGTDVPVLNEIPISVNFNMSDIREPDKVKSSYSKTVKLPMSSEVNDLFELIFEVNVALNSFNPNLKSAAKYYREGLLQFSGDLQLLKIVKKYDGDTHPGWYECSIIGDSGAIFVSMGDAYLTDLDLSDLNHSYTCTGLTDAKFVPATIGTGYAYGFIDYGFGDTTNANWKFTDLKVGIFEREYLLRIFQAYGYTWTSAFLDSSYYKHRWIPDVNEGRMKQSDAVIDSTEFYAGTVAPNFYSLTTVGTQNPTTTYYPNGNMVVNGSPFSYVFNSMGFTTPTILQYTDETTPPFFDGGTCYNNVTSIYTTATTATYVITSKNNLFFRVSSAMAGTSFINLNIYVDLQFNIGGGWVSFCQNYATQSLVAGTSYSITLQTQSPPVGLIINANIRCIIYYQAIGYYVTTGAAPSLEVTQDLASTFASKVAVSDLNYGQTVVMNQTVPKLVKQKDFFKSIIQSYNLRIEPDKTNPKNLIIEPYTAFYYAPASAKDWTYKLDTSKEIEVIPMGECDARVYEFKYTSDEDLLNKKYQDEFKETYGTERIDVNNDFINQTRTNELIFAPTPIAGNYSNAMVVPKFYKIEGSLAKNVKCKIRTLYWGGVISCGYYVFEINGFFFPSSTYPFVGHVDTPVTPTLDLSFDNPLRVYWNIPAMSYTNNNIYNAYWKRYIEEITNKDSKIVTAFFYLNEDDIHNFSFRYLIWADLGGGGAYYYVNRIIDYNPLVKQVTKVELLKINKFADFEAEAIIGNGEGGIGVIGAVGQVSGDTYEIITQDENQNYALNFGNAQGIAIGSGNSNNALGGLIIGDDNVIA